jgi:4-diphosphocytidyl-2-C-methyl-D-erythritol kinase
MTAERRSAPAKLNLYLHVLGRRADGYHVLDGLVAFCELGEAVTAAPAQDLSLTLRGPFAATLAGAPKENLVWRAAEALAQRVGRPAAAALTLEKALPVASGLGGGSSDAAAALKALDALWQLGLDDDALAEIGAALGADVPVCLRARVAWLGGAGERVEPAPALPAVFALLVNPGIPLPTRAVFAARQGRFSEPARFAAMPGDSAELAALLAERRNDLSDAAAGLVPAVGEMLDRLRALDGALLARMSGSGASCFGLFARRETAELGAALLRAERPGWWCAVGRLF